MTLTQQTAGKYKMNVWEFIRFQVVLHCTIHNVKISEPLIDTLSLLSLLGKSDLKTFCQKLTTTSLSTGVRVKRQSGKDKSYPNIFNSEQSARNFILKLVNQGLVIKDKHVIFLDPKIQVVCEPFIILNYQIVGVDTIKS